MLELQQQLCDAEDAAERLRVVNSDLASKVEVLEAGAVNATMWSQSQVHLELKCTYSAARLHVLPDATAQSIAKVADWC